MSKKPSDAQLPTIKRTGKNTYVLTGDRRALPEVHFDVSGFASLLRSALTYQDEIRKPYGPPFVVVTCCDYHVDESQTTPNRHDPFPFPTEAKADEFLKLLLLEIAKFHCPARFHAYIDPLPERNFYQHDLLVAPGDSDNFLPQFRAVLFEHFLMDVGETYWQELSSAERQAVAALLDDDVLREDLLLYEDDDDGQEESKPAAKANKGRGKGYPKRRYKSGQ